MKSILWIAGSCMLLAAMLAVSHSGAQDTVRERLKGKVAKRAEVKAPDGANAGERAAIEAVNAEFTRAFNAGDAAALAALFTEDARMSDESGKTAEGRTAIQKQLTQSLKDAPGAKIVLRTDSVKFLSGDVAVEEGASQLQPSDAADASAVEFIPYTAIFVKQNGKWLHSVVRDYRVAKDDDSAQSDADRLKELEWMIGEWVEEGTGSRSISACRYAQNKHFLVWDYTIEAEGANAPGGTMFIGRDPLSGQIKSWVFDAQGGHGEATWTRLADGQWVVKAAGVLGDGRSASATQYVTLLAKDRASWTSVDRVAGGDVQPDMSEYIIVRKPPGPASESKSNKSR